MLAKGGVKLAPGGNVPGLDFEVFRGRAAKTRKNLPTVSLQKKGVISLNPAAYEAIGSPKAVELLYAPKARVIGIRAADPDLTHSYPARVPKGGQTRLIAAVAFFNHYGIAVEKIRRYPATMVGDVLAIDLNQREEGTEDGAGARKHDGQLAGAR